MERNERARQRVSEESEKGEEDRDGRTRLLDLLDEKWELVGFGDASIGY